MAYAALILFDQTLEKILKPYPQVKFLKEKVSLLLDFLENSSEKFDLTTTDLEGKMRDAAYKGEDFIEFHLSKQIRPKSTSSFRKMFSFGAIDHDLQKIIEEFELILESVSKIKDGVAVEPRQPARNSLTSRFSFSKQNAMVGLDGNLIQIRDQLTRSSSHLEIISIVGMGGIGKTTLARNLYNESLIGYHFHIRAWVTVSQDYDLLEILIDLLNSMRHVNSESHDQMSIDQLSENLYKRLKGRRYLIVMDDVWDTNAWNDVKRLFPDDNNGSRIILTTRISEVANSFNYVHHMSFLSLEESWNLLHAKVFGEESCPYVFEEIGRKIVRVCRGLPLAVVVIGGLLSRGSRTLEYWEYIDRNTLAGTYDHQLLGILSLIYNNLPHHLKACFLYMGVFPEDQEILVSRLIKLWVAEGFLKPHYSKNLEVVAEEYLKDLIDRNLVMVGKRNKHGEMKTCIIHNILRCFCVSKGKEEKFLRVLNDNAHDLPEVGYSEYRVSIHSRILRIGKHDSRVRSFLYFAENYSNKMSLSFVRFRLLKVLDALAIKFYEFPIEIVKLVNLRYLALICRSFVKFPAAIVKLKNLQTLILSQEKYGIDSGPWLLPLEIWEMQQLRHLLLKSGLLPYPSDARRDREMVHLYTLSRVENLICRKEVFQIMPNLKKLGISYVFYQHIKRSSYDFNSFVSLYKLEVLKLSFDNHRHWESIPLNFGFPMTLKKLTLIGCRISWSNMTTVGSLPKLEVLKLKEFAFKGHVWEPNEGEFLQLKYLLLEKTDLKHWEANEMHFPNLEHLSLNYCFELLEIPTEIGNIPMLQMLEVCNCRYSVVESAKRIEEEQQRLGNDSLKVCVISSEFNLREMHEEIILGTHLSHSELSDLSDSDANETEYKNPVAAKFGSNLPSETHEKRSTRISKDETKTTQNLQDQDAEMELTKLTSVGISHDDKETKISSSSIQQRQNEKTPMLVADFHFLSESESSEASEADVEPKDSEILPVEQKEIDFSSSQAEGIKCHGKSIPSPLGIANSNFLGNTMIVTISITGEMSKFVDLKLEILHASSSQEMQHLNNGFSYMDLVPKRGHYSFLVKKKLAELELDGQSMGEHSLTGQPESSQVTDALLPEHVILNKVGGGIMELSAEKWHQACVIDFSKQDFPLLPEKPDCPDLVLLFLERNKCLTEIPSTFFNSMPALRFLDLSSTRIKILPNSLFLLTELQVLMLRNCVCLDKIPTQIKELHRMEVLDLWCTELYNFPDDIGELTNLKHLQVSLYGPDDESEYVHLPYELMSQGIISKLQALQALAIVVHPEDHRWTKIARDVMQDVCSLKMLSFLQFYFPEVKTFQHFIEMSPSWNEQKLMKFKFVVGHNVKRIISRVPNEVESKYDQQGKCLRYVNGDEVPEVIKMVLMHATAFYLDHHIKIQRVSEFGTSNLKRLKFLVVRECPNVQIIGEDTSESAFPSLEHLGVHYLWELEQIWKDSVPSGSFHALKYLMVNTCPKLEFILTKSMLQCLNNLEEFVVEDCDAVEAIIEQGKETVKYDATMLPNLQKLVLRLLPKLVSFGIDLCISEEKIHTFGCPKLILNSQSKEQTRIKQRKLLSSFCCYNIHNDSND